MFGMSVVNRRLWSMVALVSAALLVSVAAVTAQGPQPQAVLGTGFTYQGQLKNGSTPFSGSCNMQFSLWDAQGSGSPPTGGAQVGSTHPIPGVPVSIGLFTVLVNNSGQFGASAFNGQERWLQAAVQCGSDSGYTALTRQRVTAAPYASYATGNWGLNGNSGTNASNFLGTTDNMSLTLGVSGTAALRIYPNATSPNLIGGSQYHTLTVGIYGATIGGGGGSGLPNGVAGHYATIGGGLVQISS